MIEATPEHFKIIFEQLPKINFKIGKAKYMRLKNSG